MKLVFGVLLGCLLACSAAPQAPPEPPPLPATALPAPSPSGPPPPPVTPPIAKPASEIFRHDGRFWVAMEVLTRPRCLELEFEPRSARNSGERQPAPLEGKILVAGVKGTLSLSFRLIDERSVRISALHDISIVRPGTTVGAWPCSHDATLRGTFEEPLLDGAALFRDRASCERSLGEPEVLPRRHPEADFGTVGVGTWCWSALGNALDRRFIPPEDRALHYYYP